MKRFRAIVVGAVSAAAFGTLIATAPHAAATPFGDACPIVGGWLAEVPAANLEECHWQDPDGNEHMVTNPLPPLTVPPGRINPGQTGSVG